MSETQVLFGFHAVTSRLRSHPQTLQELYVDATRRDGRARDLLAKARAAGIRIVEVDGVRIQRLAGTDRHQGVAARVTAVQLDTNIESILASASEPALLLVLDGVQDPHNLGACLRIADALGAQAVIAPKDRAVGMTPVVAKVASGAAETVPYLQVTNLARFLGELQALGVWILGADQDGDTLVSQTDAKGPVAWVLGAEGEGLRRLTRERCDGLVRIPMQGTVGSLNVSVAAGICLYEARRQRLAMPR